MCKQCVAGLRVLAKALVAVICDVSVPSPPCISELTPRGLQGRGSHIPTPTGKLTKADNSTDQRGWARLCPSMFINQQRWSPSAESDPSDSGQQLPGAAVLTWCVSLLPRIPCVWCCQTPFVWWNYPLWKVLWKFSDADSSTSLTHSKTPWNTELCFLSFCDFLERNILKWLGTRELERWLSLCLPSKHDGASLDTQHPHNCWAQWHL